MVGARAEARFGRNPSIDLLSKPFTMNNLARKVAQVLQHAA